jgi:hypothetical protein
MDAEGRVDYGALGLDARYQQFHSAMSELQVGNQSSSAA